MPEGLKERRAEGTGALMFKPYIAGGPRAHQRAMDGTGAKDGRVKKEETTINSVMCDDFVTMFLCLLVLIGVGYAALHAKEDHMPHRIEM